jgi:RimJ/RimL family protein N-acetyltransferase
MSIFPKNGSIPRIALYMPLPEECVVLLSNPLQFRQWNIPAEGLPPEFLIRRSMAAPGSWWLAPRLWIDTDSRQIVGSACYKTAPENRRVEIGYGIAPSCRGQGHATEGVALLLREAFTSGEIDEVTAATTPANRSSRRVLEKNGFKIVGSGIDPDDGVVDLWSRSN